MSDTIKVTLTLSLPVSVEIEVRRGGPLASGKWGIAKILSVHADHIAAGDVWESMEMEEGALEAFDEQCNEAERALREGGGE